MGGVNIGWKWGVKFGLKSTKEVLKCLRYFRKLMWNHAAVGLAWSPGADPKAAEGPKTAWLVDFGVGAVPHVDIVLSEAK